MKKTAAMNQVEAQRQRLKAFVSSGRSGRFEVKAADDGVPEVFLYDEIDSLEFFGVSAKTVTAELEAIDAPKFRLRINSPGGDVFDGLAIANAVERHPAKVEVHIDGLAGSIASVIALAGDTVHMAKNAFMMIHNAWAISIGDADDMRQTAAVLDKIDGVIVDTYVAASGESPRTIRSLMAEETWFTAEEAKEIGFAEVITGAAEDDDAAKARFDLSVFNHVPELLAGGPEDAPPVERTIEAALRDAGFSRKEAKAFVAGGHGAVSQRDAGLAESLRGLTEELRAGAA